MRNCRSCLRRWLRTIRTNLEGDASLRLVNTAGVQQEEFRPYYLLTNILIALLSDPDIDSAGALAGLTAEQSAHLSILLPQLGDTTVEETEAKRRKGHLHCGRRPDRDPDGLEALGAADR